MKELRAGSPFIIGERTIVPVEKSTVSSNKGHHCYWFSALKEPAAIVVIEAGRAKAVDMKSCEISLDKLKYNIPGLDAILEGLLFQSTE